MLRHGGAVGDGNQTLGSHEVHVGGRGHGAGDGTPGGAAKLDGGCGASARPALASDDERCGEAEGAGARELATRGSAEATSAPHLYVTGCASARSSRGRLRRCRRRPARRPARFPRRARPPPEPPPWRDATRGGRKFIRLQTRPSRGERQLRARRTPSAASPPSSRPGASAEDADAGGGDRAGRRASYKTLLPASADGRRAPGPAAPRRSGILQLSNNFAESHHVTIQAPSNWPVGRVIQLCLLSPPASQKGPSVERCV